MGVENPTAEIQDIIARYRRKEIHFSTTVVEVACIMLIGGVGIDTLFEILSEDTELRRDIEVRYLLDLATADTFDAIEEHERELIVSKIPMIAQSEVDRSSKQRAIISYVHNMIATCFTRYSVMSVPEVLPDCRVLAALALKEGVTPEEVREKLDSIILRVQQLKI